jgi:hypothetical protein
MPDKPYSPGEVLPEDPGHGVTFTHFASLVQEKRLADIEKLFIQPSPTDWLREWLIRCWWHFYVIHLQIADEPSYKKALGRLGSAVAELTAIKSRGRTVNQLSLPDLPLIRQLAGEPSRQRSRGRPPLYAFERLVLALDDLFRHWGDDQVSRTIISPCLAQAKGLCIGDNQHTARPFRNASPLCFLAPCEALVVELISHLGT